MTDERSTECQAAYVAGMLAAAEIANNTFSPGSIGSAAANDIRGEIREAAKKSVPEGYVPVPVEPTDAMIDAGVDAWTFGPDRTPKRMTVGENTVNVYKAMLAAVKP